MPCFASLRVMPWTSWPAATRRGTSCFPIAPVAPATNTLIINSFIEDYLYCTRQDGSPGCDTSEHPGTGTRAAAQSRITHRRMGHKSPFWGAACADPARLGGVLHDSTQAHRAAAPWLDAGTSSLRLHPPQGLEPPSNPGRFTRPDPTPVRPRPAGGTRQPDEAEQKPERARCFEDAQHGQPRFRYAYPGRVVEDLLIAHEVERSRQGVSGDGQEGDNDVGAKHSELQ